MSNKILTAAWNTPLGNPTLKAVFAVLADAADKHTADCFLAVSTIARRADLSDRSVQRAINELEQRGYLVLHRRLGHSTLYQVIPKPVTESQPRRSVAPDTVSPRPRHPVTSAPDTLSPRGDTQSPITTTYPLVEPPPTPDGGGEDDKKANEKPVLHPSGLTDAEIEEYTQAAIWGYGERKKPGPRFPGWKREQLKVEVTAADRETYQAWIDSRAEPQRRRQKAAEEEVAEEIRALESVIRAYPEDEHARKKLRELMPEHSLLLRPQPIQPRLPHAARGGDVGLASGGEGRAACLKVSR